MSIFLASVLVTFTQAPWYHSLHSSTSIINVPVSGPRQIQYSFECAGSVKLLKSVALCLYIHIGSCLLVHNFRRSWLMLISFVIWSRKHNHSAFSLPPLVPSIETSSYDIYLLSMKYTCLVHRLYHQPDRPTHKFLSLNPFSWLLGLFLEFPWWSRELVECWMLPVATNSSRLSWDW